MGREGTETMVSRALCFLQQEQATRLGGTRVNKMEDLR